jgi:hypothetical protein
MNTCNREAIDAFSSLGEYRRFCAWIGEQVENGLAEQVAVQDTYAGEMFEEKWFRCKQSGDVWRLVAPDGPFHGYWGAFNRDFISIAFRYAKPKSTLICVSDRCGVQGIGLEIC